MNTDRQHPSQTSYQGRGLARPEGELTDQRLGFDVVTPRASSTG